MRKRFTVLLFQVNIYNRISGIYILMLVSSLDADIKQVKEKFGFNADEKYVVPQEVR